MEVLAQLRALPWPNVFVSYETLLMNHIAQQQQRGSHWASPEGLVRYFPIRPAAAQLEHPPGEGGAGLHADTVQLMQQHLVVVHDADCISKGLVGVGWRKLHMPLPREGRLMDMAHQWFLPVQQGDVRLAAAVRSAVRSFRPAPGEEVMEQQAARADMQLRGALDAFTQSASQRLPDEQARTRVGVELKSAASLLVAGNGALTALHASTNVLGRMKRRMADYGPALKAAQLATIMLGPGL